MAQDWRALTSGDVLESTDLLSDSRGYINDALKALRSSFSGTAHPGDPVAGQWHLDTDDNALYLYNGSTWYQLGTVTDSFFNLLPRSAGSGYAMTGALYLGSNQIKGVASPTLATDAVTKGYADGHYLYGAGAAMSQDIDCSTYKITTAKTTFTDDTEFVRKAYVDAIGTGGGTFTADIDLDDTYNVIGSAAPTDGGDLTNKDYVDGKFHTTTGHNHDGTDSKRVLWTDVETTGESVAGKVIASDGASGVSVALIPIAKHELNSGSESIGLSWVDIADVTVTIPEATNTVYVLGTATIYCSYSGGLYGNVNSVGARIVLNDTAETSVVGSNIAATVGPGNGSNYATIAISGSYTGTAGSQGFKLQAKGIVATDTTATNRSLIAIVYE